jgi:hypothetical protein
MDKIEESDSFHQRHEEKPTKREKSIFISYILRFFIIINEETFYFVLVAPAKVTKNTTKKVVKKTKTTAANKVKKVVKSGKSQSSKASSEDKKFKKVKRLTTKVSISEFDKFVGESIAAFATEKDQ